MSKLITDFAPQQWCRQTNASPSLPPDKIIPSNPQSLNARYRTKLCVAIAACLLTQLLTFVSLASAFDNFDLIDDAAHPQSGRLGESYNEYPIDSQSLAYSFLDDVSPSYSQTGFNSGIGQVSYDSQSPVQNFQQAYYDSGYSQNFAQAPVEYYPSEQAYASYQKMPSVPQQQTSAQTYTSSASSSGNVQPGLAQQKAVQAAQSGVRGHLGGGLGGAKYEGVGWSNHSAQNAINSCCYWGTRPTAQIGVSKGHDGFWYACVLYY